MNNRRNKRIRSFQQFEAGSIESDHDSGDEDIDITSDVPKPTSLISETKLSQKEKLPLDWDKQCDEICESISHILSDVEKTRNATQNPEQELPSNANENEIKIDESIIELKEGTLNECHTARLTPLQYLMGAAAIATGDYIIAIGDGAVFINTLKNQNNFNWKEDKNNIYSLDQFKFRWLAHDIFGHYDQLKDENKLCVDPLTRFYDGLDKLKKIQEYNKFRYKNNNNEVILVEPKDGHLIVEPATGKIFEMKDDEIKKTYLFDPNKFDLIGDVLSNNNNDVLSNNNDDVLSNNNDGNKVEIMNNNTGNIEINVSNAPRSNNTKTMVNELTNVHTGNTFNQSFGFNTKPPTEGAG